MTDAELKILSLPSVQERIAEAMGKWEYRDLYYIPGFGIETIQDYEQEKRANKLPHRYLRLPLAMPGPGVDDKRTLWGMVDWKRADIERIEDNGNIFMWAYSGENQIEITATPYLALLLALCAQWGIEV